ncbi:quinate 5-dehydrogenase [Moorella sulfitireducens (nom. illeg.)]|uniref:quinate 5-dehydrogenase n=1 Tax=Neomoorella sulfitireducens TaxID=2972948 RepID=UPI0021AD3B9F|nr:quinate 5-dehydrogenase [Moorella sulfitireducens]
MAARLLKELDGKVDALGLGGVNFYYHLGQRRYLCPAARYLSRQVKRTPLVDGSGWKQWVEPLAAGKLLFLPPGSRALVVSVLDRFWLARALQTAGYPVLAGDAAFGLKIPLGFPLSFFILLGYLTMPLLARLPLAYLYPLGPEQEKSHPRYRHLFARVKIIAGDWHFIRHHLPLSLTGKVIITSGTTPDDRELLRRRGATWLLATTPVINGFSPAANAMEAILVAMGVAAPRYPELAGKLGWLPALFRLQ